MSDLPPEPMKLLPLDAWHRGRSARMVEFAGYAMPIQYDGIIAEHVWTRANAGLFDVSHMGQVMLGGANVHSGAAAALEAIVPGDITGLSEGRMRYSLLLASDGGILDDMMITATPMGLYLVVNCAVKAADIAYLRAQLPADVTITTLDDRALLALQGPLAVDALARTVPGVGALYFMEAGSFLWGHEPLWISRSGYTGEDGFEISLPASAAAAFADALCAEPEVKPVGLGARDSLRLEAGLPLYGHDLTPAIDPVEGELRFAVAKRRRAERSFAGADRIVRHFDEGAAIKRIGFTVDGKMPVREGAALFAGDAVIGSVTSGGFSPSLEYPIGMALIDTAHAAIGTVVEAEVRGRRIPVTIAAMPFVPNRYHRKGKPS